jgi:hypothetical protein
MRGCLSSSTRTAPAGACAVFIFKAQLETVRAVRALAVQDEEGQRHDPGDMVALTLDLESHQKFVNCQHMVPEMHIKSHNTPCQVQADGRPCLSFTYMHDVSFLTRCCAYLRPSSHNGGRGGHERCLELINRPTYVSNKIKLPLWARWSCGRRNLLGEIWPSIQRACKQSYRGGGGAYQQALLVAQKHHILWRRR